MKVRKSSAALLLLPLCLSCSGADSDGAPFDELPSEGEAGDGDANGDGDLQPSGTPPLVVGGEGGGEEIETQSFQPPVISGKYLWACNPASGKVALVNAETLSTQILSAGLRPTYLAAIVSEGLLASAIVLNTGTSDATLFQVSDSGIKTSRIPVHEGANQWAISESGRFAVAWSAAVTDSLDPTEGLQEVSIIRLSDEQPSARRVSVGGRPSRLTFNSKETELVAVSQHGVQMVQLEGEEKRWIPLGDGEGRDVSITKNGRHALVRRGDDPTIDIVSLDGTDEILTLTFDAPVTDLDLSKSGRAVVVVRETSELATFLVAEVLDDPSRVDSTRLLGLSVGSAELDEAGKSAVLYTNATDSSEIVVVRLEPAQDYLSYRSLDTQTPVDSVRVSPDGDFALVRAKGTEGSSSGAFSLVDLREQRFPRVFGTSSPIVQTSLGDKYGIVTASSSEQNEAHLISLDTLHVDTVSLASAPLSAGLFEAQGLAFSAQEHSEGRVTFFNFEAGDVRTLTGFELASEIVQE